jgi:hypothetical protein
MKDSMPPSRRNLLSWIAGAMAILFGASFARTLFASYHEGPVTDHFDGTRFHDPHGAPPRSAKWPEWAPGPQNDRPPARVDGGAIRIGFIGHASLLIQTAGVNLLCDPVWSDRASPASFAGPKRVNDPGIPFDSLPAIYAVPVSHGHYDHLDIATLSRLAAAHRPRVITPLGNDAVMRVHDPAIAAQAFDWHDRVEIAPSERDAVRSGR